MRLRSCLFVACLLVAGTTATTATAADHMWMGFQDDPALRWRPGRAATFDRIQQFNASVVRTTVYWSRTAPRRPAHPTNSFDRAYRFSDLDEFVRNAATRDVAVMLTIWGTPRWANGGKGENVAPRRAKDLADFARAVASRYDGRHRGLPSVQFYGVWNEPNLGRFLTPQYDKKGKPLSPVIYARLYRAAYAGIKAGNPAALIGIGETAPRGRRARLQAPGTQETLAPQIFARKLSKVRPKLRFDAWSHHPYSTLGAGPRQRMRYPNANLPMLPSFEDHLNQWFRRKSTPIWVTEYGFQTKPGQPRGVTLAKQAAYVKQSLAIVRKYTPVQMFIWFIFRDQPVSLWHSGLLNENATRKPSYNAFVAAARPFDVRNPVIAVKAGTSNPVVHVPVWELLARDGPGAPVGSTISVVYGSKTIAVVQPAAKIGIGGYVNYRLPITKAKAHGLYKAFLTIGDLNGNSVSRTATVVVR
jgi:hypothetical protein